MRRRPHLLPRVVTVDDGTFDHVAGLNAVLFRVLGCVIIGDCRPAHHASECDVDGALVSVGARWWRSAGLVVRCRVAAGV